jgi:hypothetical protein
MTNLFAGSNVPNIVPAAAAATFSFFEKVPALSSDLLDDRDNNNSLVISIWRCYVSAHRGVNELTKVDVPRHVPVLLAATAANVQIRRNVAFGHRVWLLMSHSNERIDIVEFRRNIQQLEVEFLRRNIQQREGAAAGEIIARGSAWISTSRIHLLCVGLFLCLVLACLFGFEFG